MNLFAKHYAGVSKPKLPKQERSTVREAKRYIGAPVGDGEYCKSFTMRELTRALKQMKRKGTSGADDIPPHGARSLLLDLFNELFKSEKIPQE